jgi:hypothetical protein
VQHSQQLALLAGTVATKRPQGLYFLWAVLLTLFTGIFGAPFLRLIAKTHGQLVYWFVGLVFTLALVLGALYPIAIMFGSIWLVIGLYSGLEARGLRWASCGALAITVPTVIGGIFSTIYIRSLELRSWTDFIESAAQKITAAWPLAPLPEAEIKMLVQQLPSVAVTMLILSLGTALIFESTIFNWAKAPRLRTANQLKPLEFKLPDFCVWIALFGVAFSLIELGSEAAVVFGMNILNIAVALYFFQGLAVMEVGLRVYRVGAFTRMVIYFLMVGQLFFVLSVIGLADYWLDLRRRMRTNKKPLLHS